MLIVSNYHYIREDFTAKFPSIFGLTPKQFRLQLEELSKVGSFISQQQLLDYRDKKFDKNYIFITFDDGLKEQYELAKPILDAMGIPFVFFINTSNFIKKEVSMVHKIHLVRSIIDPKDLLQFINKELKFFLNPTEKKLASAHYNYDTPENAELKYMLNFSLSFEEQQKFIDPLFSELFDETSIVDQLYFEDHMLDKLWQQGNLGSHSHRHVPLGNLSGEELFKELNHTQQFFVEKFGERAKLISFPYGSFEASIGICREVKMTGFEFGFTMERAANISVKDHPSLLARFDCNDLPGGKNDLFKNSEIFKDPPLRKWHQYEAGFINK